MARIFASSPAAVLTCDGLTGSLGKGHVVQLGGPSAGSQVTPHLGHSSSP